MFEILNDFSTCGSVTAQYDNTLFSTANCNESAKHPKGGSNASRIALAVLLAALSHSNT